VGQEPPLPPFLCAACRCRRIVNCRISADVSLSSQMRRRRHRRLHLQCQCRHRCHPRNGENVHRHIIWHFSAASVIILPHTHTRSAGVFVDNKLTTSIMSSAVSQCILRFHQIIISMSSTSTIISIIIGVDNYS